MAYVARETEKKLTLIEEVQRYLAVVDAFRALGVQPTWASEAGMAWGNTDRASDRPGVDRLPYSGGQ